MYKVQMYKGNADNAQICISQCEYLVQKHGIKFVFDTDASHYIPLEDPDDENSIRLSSVNIANEVGTLAESDQESEE